MDILGISETHLTGSDVLNVDGYVWYGRNRSVTHKKAKKGSGGVGMFVKQDLLHEYTVKCTSPKAEGILWIDFYPKLPLDNDPGFAICTVYCPPVNSPHCKEQEFYEDLYELLCVKHLDRPFVLGGDLNARMGPLQDFIEGVDEVPFRHCVDEVINSMGELLNDFLIRSNCVVLNGRIHGQNSGYTRIGSTGLSTVDYIIVPDDQLSCCDNLDIIKPSEMCTMLGCEPPPSMSDHCLLRLTWKNDCVKLVKRQEPDILRTIKKYKYDKIPEGFCCNTEIHQELIDCIKRIEQSGNSQTVLEQEYVTLLDTVKNEMDKCLPKLTIKLTASGKKSGNRTSKPWWSDILTEKWNRYKKAEQLWTTCKNNRKDYLKAEYIMQRKEFDRIYQQCRRNYQRQQRMQVIQDLKTNPNLFWKKINHIGIGTDRKKQISTSVRLADGTITNDKESVAEKWSQDFENILNADPDTAYDDTFLETAELYNSNVKVNGTDGSPVLNEDITIQEVSDAIARAKFKKSVGTDSIPAEIWKATGLLEAITRLFQHCFTHGLVPEGWKSNIINPISKGASTDPLNPETHRGLHLINAICKIYCDVINCRVTTWYEDNQKLSESQAGFRKGRSCMDQLFIITNLAKAAIDSGKKLYTCYIDLKKAFDNVNHSLLWYRLHQLGITGRMMGAIKSLYSGFRCSVRVNGLLGRWFEAVKGVKQGCLASPSLFNLFIDSFIAELNKVKAGVQYDNERISCLMYADDMVLLAEDESGLQQLLDVFHQWSLKWRLSVNAAKSGVMVFRRSRQKSTDVTFSCGNDVIPHVESYRYLGLTLNSHLNWESTVNVLSQSANRALGVVISKTKLLGLNYDGFTTLYNSYVRPIMEYGAELWGGKQYQSMTNIYTKACRFFMKVPKHTPIMAIHGDMGWIHPYARQQGVVARLWYRLCQMDQNRLQFKIFKSSLNHVNSWANAAKAMFINIGLNNYCDPQNVVNIHRKLVISNVCNAYMKKYVNDWYSSINTDTGRNGTSRNKLRTYRTFKETFEPENYLTMNIGCRDRRSLALFRCGIAPIYIETARYSRNNGIIPADQRFCRHCGPPKIEDEIHILCECPKFENERNHVFSTAALFYPDFNTTTSANKLTVIMKCPDLTRELARMCTTILTAHADSFYDMTGNMVLVNLNVNNVTNRSVVDPS